MEPIMIPYIVHESDMSREERKQRRLWIAILSMIGAFLCREFILLKKMHN